MFKLVKYIYHYKVEMIIWHEISKLNVTFYVQFGNLKNKVTIKTSAG